MEWKSIYGISSQVPNQYVAKFKPEDHIRLCKELWEADKVFPFFLYFILETDYLEAASSNLLIVFPESPPQASTSCLPPDIKAAKHSVAFWSKLLQQAWVTYIPLLCNSTYNLIIKRERVPAFHYDHHFEEQFG